jgi:hypothetical protein
MSWETRPRGGRYYTRSRRVDGRIVREYVGTGPVGELAAALDHLDREARTAQAREDVGARQELAGFDAPVQALHADVEALVQGVLLTAGFHHHHGAWRRRRG